MYSPDSFVIDNQNLKLSEELKKILSEQKTIDIASGFFNIGGFALVLPEILNTEHVRILLGKAPDIQDNKVTNAMDFFKQSLKTGMQSEDFNKSNETTTQKLIDFLNRDSVQVRIYEKSFLHGKAYIFQKLVISGSSNFTFSGFTSNTELNTVLNEAEARYIREEWFNKFWEESRDFKADFINILETSKFGNLITPYQVYLKALYELQKEDISWGENQQNTFFGVTSKVELAEFQEDAVRRVFSRLKKYNGVMVADSVGLGKTYIAKRVIEEFGFFLRRNYLIICPAQIRDNIWIKELKDLGLSENIISQEDLGSGELDDKIEKALGHKQKIENLSLIVIDESHNFRNPVSNRYESLFTLIERATTENNTPKILLLTATPINNTIWDLYFQLSLISRNNDKLFIKENVPDLKVFFKDIEKTSNVKMLEDILHEISIRRTRQYIKEKYTEATISGNKIEFPKRKLATINYNLDLAYQGLYKEISDKIEQDLKLAYYNREDYRKSGEHNNLEVGRMQALAGIFKTILLKRLESSIEAFRKSIQSQIKFLNIFIDYLKKNKILGKKYYDKFIYAIEDPYNNPDQIIELETYIEEFNPEEFDKEHFINDIELDISIYKEIYSKVIAINEMQDAKLNKLKEKLLEIKEKGKVLIFTYYTDTLNYIYEALLNDKRFFNQLGKKIAQIDGGIPPAGRQKRIEQFLNGDVDILMSTDILSEGQNLQKAQILINYDLHWNPTRMIQRAGRIDRIGSPFSEIFVYNFFPEDELEDLLRLVRRLEDKINQINQSIGLDSSVLGEVINPKVFGALSILKDGQDEEQEALLDELENEQFGGSERFWEPLKSYIETQGKDKLEELPYGIKSGLEKNKGIRGVFFYFKYKDDYNFWFLYDILTQETITNKSRILDYIICPPDEPRVVPDDIDIYDIYGKIKSAIQIQFMDIQAQVSLRADRNDKMIRDINNELNSLIEDILIDYQGETERITAIQTIMDKLEKISYTKNRWKVLKKIWQNYRDVHREWRKFIIDLENFTVDKKILKEEEFELMDENLLKLVCIDVIS